MIQVITQNSTTGDKFDISNLIGDISWKTQRVGKPAQLDISILRDPNVVVEEGSIISFVKDNVGVFFGYVFKVDFDKSDTISYVCYDIIRYWLNKDIYVFSGMTATQIIKKLAIDTKFTIGDLEDTGYVCPTRVEDGSTLLDMACRALSVTTVNTGKVFVLFDDFGALKLKSIESMKLPISIGDGQLLTDYKHSRDIDSDTCNKIILIKTDKATGEKKPYVLQDDVNISKWGKLQYYENVNDDMNEAQINEKKKQILKSKNRVKKSFTIDCVGDLRIRAGNTIYVNVSDININQKFLVETAEHKFSGGEHTMNLTLWSDFIDK